VVLGKPVALVAEGVGALREEQRFFHRTARAQTADDGRLVEDRQLHCH
jgi:hypothetical protein